MRAPWLVAAVASLQFLAPGILPAAPVCAAEPNHAGMVVRFSADANDERSWCLGFSAESISGMEALRLTGLPVLTKTYGSVGEYVCKIGDVGTGLEDCPAKDGSYWGYWRMTDKGWRHSGIGPSSTRVRCGSLDGWVWLQGGTGPAPAPLSMAGVCGSARCRDAAVGSAPSVGSPDASEDLSANPAQARADKPPPGQSAGGQAPGQPVPSATTGTPGSAPGPNEQPAAAPRIPTLVLAPNNSIAGPAASRVSSKGAGESIWSPIAVFGALVVMLGGVRLFLLWRGRRRN